MARLLVTSALPYANGPIHFGHVAGAYLPADVWVRYRRLRGDEVLFLSGTDEHGVAITIAAEREGVPYRAFVDRWHGEIAETFRRFRIEFDHFSGTNRCAHHAALSQAFFTNLRARGFVLEREEKQWYCPKDELFLADRYLEGICPKCGGSARGDECRKCGQWLDALLLREPRCGICGTPPEVRPTRHWHLDLPRLCAERIGPWFEGKIRRPRDERPAGDLWKENVARFVANMLQGLNPRPITRDLRWGVPVPLPEARGKVLYVWFDAPIGYISATAEWAEREGRSPETWKEWWLEREDTRIVHFIGKDNIGFHTIVFPSMLHGQGEAFGGRLALPANVPAMEFLNLEGRKFSTSGGWYVPLEDFFERHSADAIRWTLLQNLPETADAEFTWADYQRRVNGELADTFGNFASRVLRFIEAHFEKRVPRPAGELTARERAALASAQGALARGLGPSLDAFRFREAASHWLSLARLGNELFDQERPWTNLVGERRAEAGKTLYACVRLLEALAAGGAPFLPDATARLWEMLGVSEEDRPKDWTWTESAELRGLPDLKSRRIGHVGVLVPKIEDADVALENDRLRARAVEATGAATKKEKTVEGTSPPAERPAAPGTPGPAPVPAGKPEVAYEDFGKLDLRVGRIAAAERVPKAERLLRLEVEIDGAGERRQVLAGIAKVYDPAALLGRRVLVLVNLAPKKMMGLESKGMVLAAEGPDGPTLLQPDREVSVGATVK